MTKTLSILASLVVITLAMSVFSSSSFVSAQEPCHQPTSTATFEDGTEVEIDSATKTKTKKGTTVTITRSIDEDSAKFEDAMDSGKKTDMTIMICEARNDGTIIWTTIELTDVEIESIDQTVTDDGFPDNETIVITAKKSKTTFVNHGGPGSD